MIIYDKYCWLPITWTLANANQSRFPLDFTSYIYCLLPSVTRPTDNLNFPAQQQQLHQQFIEVRNIEFISKQLFQFFVFAFSIVIPVQIQGLSLWINQAFVTSLMPFLKYHSTSFAALEVKCLVLAFPPHPFAYFLIFGYLL